MKKARVCVVGMGIGRPNGQAISRNKRGEVAALCDIDEDRMKDFSKELPNEPKLYTDYKKMCKDKEIDAVFVGTPNQLHVPIALEAVKNGKHVLVTKPLSDSEKAARKLVEVAEAEGVVNMMSLSTRFEDDVQYLGGMAQGGELGEVYYGRARSVRRSGIPTWSLGFIKAGGGAFRDMGVHVLDAAWWMMGMPQPSSVSGVAGAKFGPKGTGYTRFRKVPRKYYSQYDSDDYGGGFIRFENGAGLQVESFWASHHPEEFQIDLFGTDAGAQLKPITVYRTVKGVPQDVKIEIPKGPEAWDNIAGHFIDCILDGGECRAPLRHGLIVQQMLEGLLQSGETGEEVRFG